MSKTFTVGLHIDGAGSHAAAAATARAAGNDTLSAAYAAQTIARAEAAGFSFATFAGSHLPPAGERPADAATAGRLDPVQQAAFSGPLTSRLGLIPQVPVTFVEPFHTATQLASVDYSSVGRAGWLVSAENSEAAARQFGRTALNEVQLQQEVRDVVEVNRRLWDTWEDDAVIRDLPTGRYLDRDKVHYTDFEGASFSVKGASIIPRPPQGQLPVLVPADYAEGVAADAVLLPATDDLPERVTRLRAEHVAGGSLLVIAELRVVIDSHGEPAGERLARLDRVAASQTSASDVSDAGATWVRASRAGVSAFVGTADAMVERIVQLADIVDGVLLIPAELDADLDELRFAVLPELIERGVFTPPQAGGTLRQTFGLPEAVNVFALAAQERVAQEQAGQTHEPGRREPALAGHAAAVAERN